MKIVLATTSKEKMQIMNTVHLKHINIASDFDESTDTNSAVYEHVKALSLGKAKSVLDKVSDSIVIGLDTVVWVNGHILEKPISVAQARHHVEECSGNTSAVITGLSMINQVNGEVVNTFVETKITLRKIPEQDIDYYIENEPNYMYASGFILETMLSNFVDKIEGSYYNILGVPVETIYQNLNRWGYNLKDL